MSNANVNIYTNILGLNHKLCIQWEVIHLKTTHEHYNKVKNKHKRNQINIERRLLMRGVQKNALYMQHIPSFKLFILRLIYIFL